MLRGDWEHQQESRFKDKRQEQPTPVVNCMQVVGGLCFAHGPFTGQGCSQWPKCATDPQIFKPTESLNDFVLVLDPEEVRLLSAGRTLTKMVRGQVVEIEFSKEPQ
jgi:hypothetical protein